MGLVPIMIAVPILVAAIIPFVKSDRARGAIVYAGAGGVMALAAGFLIV